MLEEDNVKHPKYCALLLQWVLGMVVFAALSVVEGYGDHKPLRFAMGMTVTYWLVLTLLLGFVGTGKSPVYLQPASVEAFFSVFVNIMLFASFCAIGANTLNDLNAKVAAGFAFFLWLVNLVSTWLTVDTWNKGGENVDTLPVHQSPITTSSI